MAAELVVGRQGVVRVPARLAVLEVGVLEEADVGLGVLHVAPLVLGAVARVVDRLDVVPVVCLLAAVLRQDQLPALPVLRAVARARSRHRRRLPVVPVAGARRPVVRVVQRVRYAPLILFRAVDSVDVIWNVLSQRVDPLPFAWRATVTRVRVDAGGAFW